MLPPRSSGPSAPPRVYIGAATAAAIATGLPCLESQTRWSRAKLTC